MTGYQIEDPANLAPKPGLMDAIDVLQNQLEMLGGNVMAVLTKVHTLEARVAVLEKEKQ